MHARQESSEDRLDPGDWGEASRLGHLLLDEAVDYLRGVRERPVWRAMPEEVRQRFRSPLPVDPEPLEDVLRTVREDVMGYPMGNVHPRFWAWFMGSGNFTGALADFLAAVQGSNLGGGDHAAALVDNQVVDWCKEMVGFPRHASGSLTSGGSVANLICLAVARNARAGPILRESGVSGLEKPLRFYCSDQVHSCHDRAMHLLGLGSSSLCKIPSDSHYRLDLVALRRKIAEDRAEGREPACIIANAGTVNTGAVDDLECLAELAEEEDLWLHVDGCIGALIAIAPGNRHQVKGLDKAHSLALDPHKWLHAPFDVGCCLVRDGDTHRSALAYQAEYLQSAPRGLAAGDWLYELGLQTSRGFRALKVWMALREHGIARFGRLIDRNIAQAHHLASIVDAHPELVLMAPASINIVCFRYERPGLDEPELRALNVEIMLQLQEDGIAILSDTTLRGRHCLRAAICNHRTRIEDLELVAAEIVRRGRLL